MIKALQRSKTLLEDSASLVVNFLASNINHDGGFKGRSEQSDLYYTVFGFEALKALDASFSNVTTLSFLQKHLEPEPTDLIHLTSLIRCYANLSDDNIEKELRDRFRKSLEEFRSKDGGFANKAGSDNGTIYDCFFALAAYQDLKIDMPNKNLVIECIRALSISDGSFSNNQQMKIGSTNATAAAMMVLHHLNQPVEKSTTDWLLAQCSSSGGFLAMPNAPIPDLLSTATSLHALSTTGFKTDSIKDQCLDYIDSLWCAKGAFYGNWTDKTLDCEYTYYGLLALGNLNYK
jgi:hypothetical protein